MRALLLTDNSVIKLDPANQFKMGTEPILLDRIDAITIPLGKVDVRTIFLFSLSRRADLDRDLSSSVEHNNCRDFSLLSMPLQGRSLSAFCTCRMIMTLCV